MSKPNPTRKQHFLPRFYLKQFANSDNFLYAYDKKNQRITPPRSISAVGYEHYFYAIQTGVPDKVSQEIEGWLKVYEDIIAKGLPSIKANILNQNNIQDDEKYILSSLICMLWLRSPAMRVSLNRMHEDMTKQIMQFDPIRSVDNFIKKTGSKMSPNDRKNLIEALSTGNYRVGFSNLSHLRFMTETFGFNDSGFTNMFYGQKWKIYIARGKKRFITTDNPVVEWWFPPDSFYGPTFLEKTKYFSLSPEIFIELLPPVGSKKINRKTIFEDQDDKIRMFNLLLASRGSASFVYSADKLSLEEIVNSRSNPGALEREIYKKYDYPWVLYKQRNGNR